MAQKNIVIETDRLILRKWQEEDFLPFYNINSCPNVCEFLKGILSREESDALAGRIITQMQQNSFGLYAVDLKDSGEFIGFTGLNIPSFEAHFMPAIEIGWRLAYKHWGKGYATEGAKAVIDYAFNEIGLKKIVSFTAVSNLRSRNVMQKIGMSCDKKDDFHHPLLSADHPLSKHVLYRIKKLNKIN